MYHLQTSRFPGLANHLRSCHIAPPVSATGEWGQGALVLFGAVSSGGLVFSSFCHEMACSSQPGVTDMAKLLIT